MTPGAAAPAPQLVLPKKSCTQLSDAEFAELRAEFLGTAPSASPPSTARGEPPSPPSSPGAPAPASGTCTFCGEPLGKLSKPLRAMMQYWHQRAQKGHVVRPTDTLAVCQRHRDERDVIPAGRARGWPMRLDFQQLRRRVTAPHRRYMRVLEDMVRQPSRSAFFHDACERHAAEGRKAGAGARQLESFHRRQTG